MWSPTMVNPKRCFSSSKMRGVKPVMASHSRRQRTYLNEIKLRARAFHRFGHGGINRVVDWEDKLDRCTICNAEHESHDFLDMIYVGLQRWCLTKKLGHAMRVEVKFM